MKKDRNCGGNYPVYPYPTGAMPGIGFNALPNMVPNYSMNNMVPNYSVNNMANPYASGNSNLLDQQLASLNSQISSLERRVNNLENLVGNNSNKYNTSNYQML